MAADRCRAERRSQGRQEEGAQVLGVQVQSLVTVANIWFQLWSDSLHDTVSLKDDGNETVHLRHCCFWDRNITGSLSSVPLDPSIHYPTSFIL